MLEIPEMVKVVTKMFVCLFLSLLFSFLPLFVCNTLGSTTLLHFSAKRSQPVTKLFVSLFVCLFVVPFCLAFLPLFVCNNLRPPILRCCTFLQKKVSIGDKTVCLFVCCPFCLDFCPCLFAIL